MQTVAIVSERGEIKGYLKIALQQLQVTPNSPSADQTNEQIKLMRTYRNASGMTKVAFDDETYFRVMQRLIGDIKSVSRSSSGTSKFVISGFNQIL